MPGMHTHTQKKREGSVSTENTELHTLTHNYSRPSIYDFLPHLVVLLLLKTLLKMPDPLPQGVNVSVEH